MNPSGARPNDGCGVKVLLYVQHLLGLGHLMRSARIAAALAARGCTVAVAQGGEAVAGVSWGAASVTALDPVRVDPAAMGVLLAADGSPFGPERQAARRDALLAMQAELCPDILLIEAYPFGRRQMRFELAPLLEAAKPAGVRLVAASIRDILQESRRPGRQRETIEALRRWFDLVLVHGDPAFVSLADTFALAGEIPCPVAYTGLVGPPPPGQLIAAHDIIVSAGGGAVGGRLLTAAATALAATDLSRHRALLLTGPNAPAGLAETLARLAPGAAVASFVGAMPERLSGARLAICQAGYNTAADLMVTGCPAVLVPFEGKGETEQLRRAKAFAEHGRAIVLREEALTPAALAEAIRRALELPRRAGAVLEGAARTADILLARPELLR
ncbi:MAG: glycosyl transferase [Methylocystis sp.]|nr:glycosyl transferase [Methylocystis sp.]MCA3584993.1 glycosyl transferase [Methylocystis sp.]MCA3586923.1 glycosyl transferase [Methylocystis sp.]MCA3592211.1 glycosyl transferase [Methylocystis sp.]